MSVKRLVLIGLIIIGLVSVAFPSWAEKVTLVFSDWHLTEPHWEQALKEGIAVFETENPEIKVKLDYVSYAEKETKYATALEAGKGPDVFHLHAYSMRSFIERGYLYDITEFIGKEGECWYGKDFLDPWYPQTLKLVSKDGRYYGLPDDFMAMVLFRNKRLLQEAGLPPDTPPKTWDDFLSYAKKLTQDRDGDGRLDTWGFGTVGAISPGFELRFTPVLFSHGGSYLTADNKRSALDTPGAKRAFKFFVELYIRQGVIPPGVTARNPGDVREQLATEEVAMILGSGWTVPIVSGLNPDLNAPEVLEASSVPVAAGVSLEFRTTAWLSTWVIGKNTRYPEEAWKLLKHQTSKPMAEKWFRDARVLSSRKDVSGGLEALGITGYNELLYDKFASVIAKELAYAKFVPQVKEWPEIIETINTAVQEAFTGAKSPEEALSGAHRRINDILR
jgi:multiple sugar transport system substrate-binding protein